MHIIKDNFGFVWEHSKTGYIVGLIYLWGKNGSSAFVSSLIKRN